MRNRYVMIPALPQDKKLLRIVAATRGMKLYELMHVIANQIKIEQVGEITDPTNDQAQHVPVVTVVNMEGDQHV